jgi:hypothetical protein
MIFSNGITAMIRGIAKIILPALCAILFIAAADVSVPPPPRKSPKPISSLWKTANDFQKAETTIVRKIKWISDNPFAPTRKDSAQMVVQWAVRVPYLTVKTNVEYISDFLASVDKYPYTAEVMTMYMFGTLEYIIRNPKTESDSIEAVKAGFSTMITMYTKMKSIRKDSENPVLDKYSRMLADSTFDEYIRSNFYDPTESSEP